MSSMKLLQAHQVVVKQRQTNKLTKIHCQILLVQRISFFFCFTVVKRLHGKRIDVYGQWLTFQKEQMLTYFCLNRRQKYFPDGLLRQMPRQSY